MPTKRTWYPGHDGRATGWAIRVERGVMALADVPANERKGAEIMLQRRAADRRTAAGDRAAAANGRQALGDVTKAIQAATGTDGK